jgi:hypothetical protein
MIRTSVISTDGNLISEYPEKSGDGTGKYILKTPDTERYSYHDQYELKSDKDILTAIRSALHTNVFIHDNNILVNVSEGWVYLEGSVENEDQRNLAKKMITDIFGVNRVTNYLTFPRHSERMN